MNSLHIAQGNPGAIRVLIELQTWARETFDHCQSLLERHDICGPRLWMAYKDYAKGNIDVMMTGIHNHSPELLTAIRCDPANAEWDWANG